MVASPNTSVQGSTPQRPEGRPRQGLGEHRLVALAAGLQGQCRENRVCRRARHGLFSLGMDRSLHL